MEEYCFKEQLSQKQDEVDKILEDYLPVFGSYQKCVADAMAYSVEAGGKRLRPILMLAAYQMFGGDRFQTVVPFMAAMEMIHTYSLVHDDLPAMDNDEYRRGKETTWKAFGNGMGVLAGDGLLNYAYEILLDACSLGSEMHNFETVMAQMGAKSFPREDALDVDNSYFGKGFDFVHYSIHEINEIEAMDEVMLRGALIHMQRRQSAAYLLAHKAGVYGMIGGQCADLLADGCEETIEAEELLFIHEHKTAALIEASLMVGAVLAGADEENIKLMETVGSKVGLAFQVQDDILDVIGDATELGKATGSDAANKKQTYVTLYGLEKAKETVETLTRETLEILKSIPGDHEFLDTLLLSLMTRTK